MASFRPSSASYDDPLVSEAPHIPDVGGHRPPLPAAVVGRVPHRQAVKAASRQSVAEATSPGWFPAESLPKIPTGNKDLVLLTSTDEESASLTPAGEAPLWKRDWFWPVVIFGIAFGVVASK